MKVVQQLNSEIDYLEKLIKQTKNANELIKLRIRKKELYLQKLELEKN